jgi:hypothetical protein
MRRSLLAVAVATAVVLQFAPAAVATGPGGWDHLGNGGSSGVPALNGHVTALNTQNPGILYVGGPFTNAGGIAHADHLARWNGSTWSAVNGSKTLNGAVDAIAYNAGHIYVGGEFTNVGGDPNIDYLAEWTGSGWTSPCTTTTTGPPITAQVDALQIVGTTLYVGGAFADGGGLASADFLVRCSLADGTPTSTVANDGDFNSGVTALAADSDGILYAGGQFVNQDGVTGRDHVASYDGTTWSGLGGSQAVDDKVRSLTAHGTSVYIGTDAVNIAGIPQADHIAKWDATNQVFSAVGSNTAGTDGWFNSFAFLNGMATYGSLLFVAGSFQNANGVATADDVAYFDGTHWHPLGSDGAGNGPLNSPVNALAVFNGGLVAGGNFTSAGGDSNAKSIASHSLRLPDAAIAGTPTGSGVGGNVYSSTGAGEKRDVTVRRGHRVTSYVRIQNDGVVAASFGVKGLGSANGITAHWFAGSTNVTTGVRNGTYSTASIDPGAHVVLRLVVRASASSSNHATFTTTARSTAGTTPDAVRLDVTAKG